jgi:putative transcriptional regulator
MSHFAKQLTELRTNRGLNQRELAELVQVRPATISHLEMDRLKPSITLALRLAKEFGVSLDVLMGTHTGKPRRRHAINS